jgi:hypothetical protein
MTRRGHTARSGLALFAALSLLVLLGILTAGAFAATTLAQRAARLGQSDEALAAAADYAATTILGATDSLGLAGLPLGVTRSFDVPPPQADLVTTTVEVTRLPHQLLWLVAEARQTTSGGRRRVGMLARFHVVGPTPAAGLVARGDIGTADSVVVTVDSTGPPDCRPATAALAVLTAHPGDSTSYFLEPWQLAALDSAPLVRHVRGDTTITGGVFSGIMIVDGDATIAGAFTLVGLLAARGRVRVSGSIDAHGALMAFGSGAGGAEAIQVAAGNVRYDPCAIEQVFRLAFAPRPVRRRSWSELF